MKIETIILDELKRSDISVRKHPEVQLKELCRAVKMFGQTRPIIIDEDNIVLAGNGLLDAFLMLNEPTIQAYRIPNLTRDQKLKLMISDNKIFDLGVDDYKGITEILKTFDDFDVPGFDSNFLKDISAGLDKLTEDYIGNFGKKSDNEPPKTIPKGSTDEYVIVCPKCGTIIDDY